MLGCQQKPEIKEESTDTKVIKKTEKPTISVQEKKARFKKILLPQIQEVYTELNIQYNEIVIAIQNDRQTNRIEALKKEYKAKSNEELLMALKPHPISVTLAQAAMESSWGTSRFYSEAKNIFGIWSFNKNEPRIAASGMRGTKTIWLKKYDTIKESVQDYYKNLGRSYAFKEFRKEKMISNNPYILVTKLDKYSEKGALYGKELTSMISYNKFVKYDEVFFKKPEILKTVNETIELTKNDPTQSNIEMTHVQPEETAIVDVEARNEVNTENNSIEHNIY